MPSNLGSFAIAVVIATGCAPPVDGPIERQRAIDREDGDRLAAQLLQLPGVVAANVVLHHAMRDPLAVAPPTAATFGAVIATDDQAAPDAIRAATLRHALMQRDPRIAKRIKDVVEKRVGREVVSPKGDIVTEEIE